MLNADSRQYRFAYELHNKADVPSDFPALLSENDWLAALFMPGDTDTFWQPPEYSPRIYLLKSDRLLIHSHPASAEDLFEMPLKSLIAVELQKSLLYGIVQFHAATASRHFRYSTVHQWLFNRFLRSLRSQWLGSAEPKRSVIAMQYSGQHSSARCTRELTGELDLNECLHDLHCQPAIRVKERTWFLRRSRTAPALLIALTNRRVIAISTGAGDRNDPYEMALRYAPAAGLSAVDLASEGSSNAILQIRLKNNVIWRFAISDARSPSVVRLLATVRNLISSPRDEKSNPPIPG
jgi:hypothetical protein